MGSKNQSFKHVCKTCGYSTNRLSNFKDHLNRKKPCKPTETESMAETCKPIVNPEADSVIQNVNLEAKSVSLGVNLDTKSLTEH